MGNTRQWTTKFNANNDSIEAALKAHGITKNRRKRYIAAAAAGRPSDLAEQARVSLALRRIAGFAPVKKAQEQGRGNP